MKNYITPASIVSLILLSNYLGYVAAPFSILVTPILFAVSALLLFYYTDYSLKLKYMCMTFVVIVNDILVKLFAGGDHDPEGQGWITGFLLIGLIVMLPVIISYSITKKVKALHTLFYILISGLVLLAYMSYFDTLGTNELESPAVNRTDAKKEGLYLSDVTFSDSSFNVGNDTFYIKGGWLQSQRRINHSGLIKSARKDKNNFCTIELKGNFDKYGCNDNAFFKVNGQKGDGLECVRNIIDFPISSTCYSFDLNIFSIKDSCRLVKSIRVKPKSIL